MRLSATSAVDHVDQWIGGLLTPPSVWCSLLSQQIGFVTLRVLSRPGRVTKQGHVMTIVKNVLGEAACDEVGRIRMLPAATCADGLEVRGWAPLSCSQSC